MQPLPLLMTSIENILQERKGYWLKILKKSTKPDWLNIDSPQVEEYDVIVGWDTEYRNREWKIDLEKDSSLSNFISSTNLLLKDLTKTV
jgi:G:T-mismatch repair DNA endonuclease (very short patch repair protein)